MRPTLGEESSQAGVLWRYNQFYRTRHCAGDAPISPSTGHNETGDMSPSLEIETPAIFKTINSEIWEENDPVRI